MKRKTTKRKRKRKKTKEESEDDGGGGAAPLSKLRAGEENKTKDKAIVTKQRQSTHNTPRLATASQWVGGFSLVSSIASARQNLQVLCLSRCNLPEKSTTSIGFLLNRLQSLSSLDLAGNTNFSQILFKCEEPDRVHGSAGLRSLRFFSPRWCHIPPHVHLAIQRLLEACCTCQDLTLDLQGNRASRSMFDGFACLKGCQGC